MTNRSEFAHDKPELKAQGVQDKVEIPFGKPMMNAIDKGYSPLMKLQEVIAARMQEQENFMQIARDNFLQNNR